MMDYSKNIISESSSIKDALLVLNGLPTKDSLTLFVADANNILKGAITDGDIRRGLLAGFTIESKVSDVMNKTPKFIQRNKFTIDYIDELKAKELDLIPIVDEEKKIFRIIDLRKKKSVLPVDAVLMAGGEGVRLRPLTENTPKPMLEVGGKPIIERNIERLESYGVDHFHITIKYLGEKIRNHFKDGKAYGVDIKYTEEKSPLGTIGALALIPDIIHNDILIMNSDLLTNIDFEDFYKFFKNQDADIAIATTPYHVSLPYGIVETDGHKVVQIQEKPTYTYYSNAGIYLIKKKHKSLIPENKFFNATDLIDELIAQKMKVVNYPILTYWLDIGSPQDFKNAQEDIKHLKF